MKLDLKYDGLWLCGKYTYMQKAVRICELYATKLRMSASRALSQRYNLPFTERDWPMLGLSTAEHSFMMAQMIVQIYLEFLDAFLDKDIPPEKAESEALHHDDAEALTGDAATDVDGVTREMKDAAETKSIERQYHSMACHSYMRVRHEAYEAKESYLSKFVKMMDALDLVFFAQYCVRNGVGMICRHGDKDFALKAFGEKRIIDRRTHKEVSPYFEGDAREEVPISEIMYDHSLPRVEKLGRPELTNLFKLLCAQAFGFPFEQYNLVNLPMDFANLS